MRRASVSWSVAALVAALAACGTSPPDSRSSEAASAGSVTSSPTNDHSPSSSITSSEEVEARVTDEVYAGLSEEEAERLLEECEGSLGVPGTGDTCFIPKELPKCSPRHRFCLRMGTVAGEDLGVLQVRDSSLEGNACGTGPTACPLVVVTSKVTSGVRVTDPPRPTQTDAPTNGPTTSPRETPTGVVGPTASGGGTPGTVPTPMRPKLSPRAAPSPTSPQSTATP